MAPLRIRGAPCFAGLGAQPRLCNRAPSATQRASRSSQGSAGSKRCPECRRAAISSPDSNTPTVRPATRVTYTAVLSPQRSHCKSVAVS